MNGSKALFKTQSLGEYMTDGYRAETRLFPQMKS